MGHTPPSSTSWTASASDWLLEIDNKAEAVSVAYSELQRASVRQASWGLEGNRCARGLCACRAVRERDEGGLTGVALSAAEAVTHRVWGQIPIR